MSDLKLKKIAELKLVLNLDEREHEDHGIAEFDESDRYIKGTSYSQNADYILFAKEINYRYDLKGKRVLDVCCGPGGLAIELCKYEPLAVVGMDGSTHMIEYATNIFKHEKLYFECADVLTLDLSLEKFDLIVCQNAVHHFDDESLKTFMNSCLDSLKRGGKIYFADYRRDLTNFEALLLRLEDTHSLVYDDLINTIKASFKVEELKRFFESFDRDIGVDIFLPTKEFEYLKSLSEYEDIIKNDPHPHYLDYELSLRAEITLN